MSEKIKILSLANQSRAYTGFGKAMKNVLLNFYNDPEFEFIEAGCGATLGMDLKTPWRSYGTFPNDQGTLMQIQGNAERERAAQYGFYTIDKIVEEVEPDIVLLTEDIWAFHEYEKKPWWNKVHKIIWTTLDSIPILDLAHHLAPKCDDFWVWAGFAQKEMQKQDVDCKLIHGPINFENFYPLNEKDLYDTRNGHGLDDKFVIGFVFKNQLRKSVPNLLDGFKLFKAKHPKLNPVLLLHTDWSEIGGGWDIPKYLREKQIDQKDVLATYICHQCDRFYISPYSGEDKDCHMCGAQKTVKTKTSNKGVTELQLNQIYNCMDVYCHPFTSGGQEIPIQEAKAAGLITLVTSYSCGTDCCYPKQGGLPLDWKEYREPHTQFIKATTLPESICKQLDKVAKMSKQERKDFGQKGRDFVLNEFSTQVICAKMRKIFKKIKTAPIVQVSLDQQQQTQTQNLDFGELLDNEGWQNRIAVVMPESAGDVLMCNSLMEDLKDLYSDCNIYFFTKPQFFDVIEDNPYIHKVVPFQDGMDNLLFLEGQGGREGYFKCAFLPHLGSQRMLNYLHNGQDTSKFEYFKNNK
jgi:glycosyltransferase involved in cell wall biosynthesis